MFCREHKVPWHLFWAWTLFERFGYVRFSTTLSGLVRFSTTFCFDVKLGSVEITLIGLLPQRYPGTFEITLRGLLTRLLLGVYSTALTTLLGLQEPNRVYLQPTPTRSRRQQVSKLTIFNVYSYCFVFVVLSCEG